MDHFQYIDGDLHAEAVPLADIARTVGTPTYVYSTATLTRHYRVLSGAIEAQASLAGRSLVAFAVKANSNLSVLATLGRLGAGADTVSEGEIRRALAAGIPADRIIFSGVGKTDAELAFALRTGVRQVNIESAPELDRLERIATATGIRPDISIRVNPGVGAGGHAKITTGGGGDKFGVPVDEALSLYARAATNRQVRPVGLACHIGSQILDLAPLRDAFGVLADMTRRLRADGHTVGVLDLGGGLGVPYEPGLTPPDPATYAAMVGEAMAGLDVDTVFEPGRLLVANAGVLLARVIHVNERPDGRRFLVLDAAMNDLMRPALYDAFHPLVPVRDEGRTEERYDVVGPVCETGDTFARDRLLPLLAAGDLVAFKGAGAYGAAMASEYNSRPLVPEVLVDGDRFAVVRPRPDYAALLARETVAPWLDPDQTSKTR
ncbi:diaminopimelate decarboxylase [Brevundimonas sp.]|uniref:diaminopimelate decarboxylase n=1 Tax=Brevundimonas sp. TaxID=1871086 RepID=UPI001DB8C541|nr:diaminopimelate decarboxylase [Brevundimonas sp.]MBL0946616.1 diaminopimelate decarboxylase [Brevundimonas sp.]